MYKVTWFAVASSNRNPTPVACGGFPPTTLEAESEAASTGLVWRTTVGRILVEEGAAGGGMGNTPGGKNVGIVTGEGVTTGPAEGVVVVVIVGEAAEGTMVGVEEYWAEQG